MAITCHEEPGFAKDAPEKSEAPFINQMAGVPSVFCHRISALPSPLKSHAPIARQEAPGLNPAIAPLMSVVPSMNQITGVPSAFCQRMSDLPSPLKSPAAFTVHEVPGLGPTPEAPA